MDNNPIAWNHGQQPRNIDRGQATPHNHHPMHQQPHRQQFVLSQFALSWIGNGICTGIGIGIGIYLSWHYWYRYRYWHWVCFFVFRYYLFMVGWALLHCWYLYRGLIVLAVWVDDVPWPSVMAWSQIRTTVSPIPKRLECQTFHGWEGAACFCRTGSVVHCETNPFYYT